MEPRALRLAGPSAALDAELLLPDAALALLVLAHGAGADMRHVNMVSFAEALARQRIATLRFNFPFMQQGRRRVDGRGVCVTSLAAAVEAALGEGLPLYLGGHSFGGRMASHAVVDRELPVRGLVLCSFPLHQPKRPAVARAAHLADVPVPMLFLSGTRDALADAHLLAQVVAGLGDDAELHWLATADHSYRILKRQRPASPSVFDEMAQITGDFVARHNPAPA